MILRKTGSTFLSSSLYTALYQRLLWHRGRHKTRSYHDSRSMKLLLSIPLSTLVRTLRTLRAIPSLQSMGYCDFKPPGAPKLLNRSSWNLARSIASSTRPHMPKFINVALGVYNEVNMPTRVYFFIFIAFGVYRALRTTWLDAHCTTKRVLVMVIFTVYRIIAPIYTTKTAISGATQASVNGDHFHVCLDSYIITKNNRNVLKMVFVNYGRTTVCRWIFYSPWSSEAEPVHLVRPLPGELPGELHRAS